MHLSPHTFWNTVWQEISRDSIFVDGWSLPFCGFDFHGLYIVHHIIVGSSLSMKATKIATITCVISPFSSNNLRLIWDNYGVIYDETWCVIYDVIYDVNIRKFRASISIEPFRDLKAYIQQIPCKLHTTFSDKNGWSNLLAYIILYIMASLRYAIYSIPSTTCMTNLTFGSHTVLASSSESLNEASRLIVGLRLHVCEDGVCSIIILTIFYHNIIMHRSLLLYYMQLLRIIANHRHTYQH